MLRVNEADIFALRTGLDIVVYVNVLIKGKNKDLQLASASLPRLDCLIVCLCTMV